MRPKHLYLVLSILGTILPYYYFVPFVAEHGLNVSVFLEQLFSSSISSFFAMDVVVSSIVLWVLAFTHRHRVKYFWIPILANFVVGVSLGLPLFLYLRESGLPGSVSRPTDQGIHPNVKEE